MSPPEVALLRIHRALAGSCGGAVAIAELDPDAHRLRFVGIGNIAAIRTDDACVLVGRANR